MMPIGQFHAEKGLLLRQRGRLILQKDDGGFWVLDAADTEAEQLLGQRVRVEGLRSGFNVLDIARIVRC